MQTVTYRVQLPHIGDRVLISGIGDTYLIHSIENIQPPYDSILIHPINDYNDISRLVIINGKWQIQYYNKPHNINFVTRSTAAKHRSFDVKSIRFPSYDEDSSYISPDSINPLPMQFSRNNSHFDEGPQTKSKSYPSVLSLENENYSEQQRDNSHFDEGSQIKSKSYPSVLSLENYSEQQRDNSHFDEESQIKSKSYPSVLSLENNSNEKFSPITSPTVSQTPPIVTLPPLSSSTFMEPSYSPTFVESSYSPTFIQSSPSQSFVQPSLTSPTTIIRTPPLTSTPPVQPTTIIRTPPLTLTPPVQPTTIIRTPPLTSTPPSSFTPSPTFLQPSLSNYNSNTPNGQITSLPNSPQLSPIYNFNDNGQIAAPQLTPFYNF